ncbi:MAG: Indole-3-glycerol-phosphate synthase [Thermoleophilia bacterium]|nr:Indole-3-glycerol-phosphate synthase [Thermoleophilia bacterium]
MTAGTGTYLDRIVEDVRRRLDVVTADVRPAATSARRSLIARIEAARAREELAVIAEVKRRSPSVGEIDLAVDPGEQAGTYEGAGAVGISVLTEPDHFGGTLDDLVAARSATREAAVLRKDFIIDASQLEDAAAVDADAVLLIAALHETGALVELAARAGELGLEVLLEVHDEAELERALATDVRLIGINNRDLRSFVVDLATSERLAPLVPSDRLIVAESGVRTPEDAARLRAAGVDALLVGEALMRAREPGGLLRALATAKSPGAST